MDELETLNRIVAGFDGSLPVPDVIRRSWTNRRRVRDHAGVDVPAIGSGRLTMVGVAGYQEPIHEIDIGVGIIGRAAATRQTQFSRMSSRTPTTGRRARTSEARLPPRSSMGPSFSAW